MKILYFGSFEKPYDTEVYVANTLEMMGHIVTRVSAHDTSPDGAIQILKTATHDFILLSKGWHTVNYSRFMEAVRATGIYSVGWYWDLLIGTSREGSVQSNPVFLADFTLTTDGGHNEEFKAYGVNHALLRQGIYEPEAHPGDWKQEYFYDVVFVGTEAHGGECRWDYRKKLLDFLQKTYGSKFRWLGQHQTIRNEELNNLYASARVVVGDSVYSPHYWSNRLYETTGRGGFLIFPEIPGLEKEFEYYKQIVPYRIGDWEGLKEKIDYFVTHDVEREKIQMAGFEHCKQFHTYTKRCEELIKIVNERKGR